MTVDTTALPSLDPVLNERVRQFQYVELELLNAKRFQEWLNVFSDDVRYWMPLRRVRPPRERDIELTSPDELAVYDETKEDLVQRVTKIETGKAWAEEPPSRTRHSVTNTRVREIEDGYEVRSNFLVFQGRQDKERTLLVGERTDLVRERSDGIFGLSVYRRTIVIDDATLVVPSVSIFF
ncbi:hypothetical protein A3731_11820 [Roseovarius sp. HI0049]|nr:hypothetical protein A3731_11820 [Roseovarius sp. HI0049]